MVDGMLDSTFGTAGFVRFSPTTGFGYDTSEMLLDSSGRMIIAGSNGINLWLSRRTASGLVDATFGDGGTREIVSPNAMSLHAPDIAIDGAGRIVVAATAQTSERKGFFVARFSSDGQPDVGFGDSGQILDVSVGTGSQVQAVAIAAGDQVVVSGSTPEGSPGHNLVLARYTAAGVADTTFGLDGTGTIVHPGAPTVTDPATGGDAALAIDNSGRILAVGYSLSGRRVARFTSTGVPDGSFGTTGYSDQFVSPTALPFALTVDATGRIIVAGSEQTGGSAYDRQIVVARYNGDGGLDAAFGSAGTQAHPIAGYGGVASAVRVDSSGRIVVAAKVGSISDDPGYALLRLSPSGQLDTSFGPWDTHFVLETRRGTGAYLYAAPALALDAQGRAVVVSSGNDSSTGGPKVLIARYGTATTAGAPTAVEVEQFWEGELVVGWDPATEDGGTPITGYVATASPGGASCTTDATPGDEFCFIDGLTTGVSYTVSVKAVNRAGTGSAATSPAVTPVWIPDEPTNVSVTPSAGGATVSWAAPIDTGSLPITGYVATAMPGGATCSTTATTCTFSGLIGGTTYTFWVYANNSLGEGYDSEDVSTVVLSTLPIAIPLTPQAPPPAAPADTTAPLATGPVTTTGTIAPDGTVGANLNWALPGDSDVATVRLGIKEGAGTPTSTETAAGVTVSLSRTGATLGRLRPGATYTVAVYTLDAAGNMSAGVTATLAGSRARVSAPATSTAGQAIPVRLSLFDVSNRPLSRRPVEVLVRAAGARAWRVHGRALTNARGEVLVSARPTTNTQFALRYVGGPGALGVSAGGVATVRVRSSVSSLMTVGSRAGLHLAPRRGVARLTGAVIPGKRSAPVYLQKLVGRTWRNVAMTRLDARGRYAFVLPTARPGTATYRVYRPADATNLAGASAGQVLTVR